MGRPGQGHQGFFPWAVPVGFPYHSGFPNPGTRGARISLPREAREIPFAQDA